ncbi:MAG: fibronectin/fibrinogen-binding protein [Oscillospiraceae bacterium]|nr:fibronectin/fibrinogen-binding protein [Oscillospiraceae bacterium]
MPLDAICMTALRRELEPVVAGARIDKLYQPERDEILLSLRSPTAGNVRLLLTANPSHPRMQLTQAGRENPAAPPMFCMLLRKHLSGGRILSLTQPPMERLLDLEVEALDELGCRVQRHLVLEAMGRRANLILLDGEGRIIDCIRRLDGDITAQRQVLPGLFYRLPPAPDKRNPLELAEGELSQLLGEAPPERKISDWLLDTFGGISPLTAREIAFRAAGETDARLSGHLDGVERELNALLLLVEEGRFSPVLLRREGGSDFSFQPILQYGPAGVNETLPSFSELLDRFYAARETAERVRQRGQDLIRALTNARDRTARKLANQERELTATQDRERQRELGDLVTSSLHLLSRGMKSFRTSDFYDPEGKEVEISLEPLLTPQQNAAKYYKTYNKAKTAERVLTEQLEKGRRELDYLESVLEEVGRAEGERDLQEIRQELTDTGYLRKNRGGKKPEKRLAPKPMEFRSSAGLRISVGKNNTQNDQLTCKQAFKSDIWFHTQKIHGSHVILWTEGKDPDLQSVTEAAVLAAYYSQAREGKNVPVDYTPVKYVKKPNGAKPGMVIYETYSTAYVTPDEELARRLRVK